MKKAMCIIGMLFLACALPALAQGPFADVPTDHWAYDSVNELQMKGIVIGYPDGTFGGKRAMTRYEFAMAISRMIPMLESGLSDRLGSLESRVKALDGKTAPPGTTVQNPQPPIDTSNFVTKADLAKIQKLVDEFKDELASLGVDVDALRKDVAALNERVTVIEEKMARLKISFDAQVMGLMPKNKEAGVAAVDRDNRLLSNPRSPDETDLLDNVTFIRQGNLKFDFKNDNASAVAMVSIGNYLPYLGFVDDYIGGVRPTNKNSSESLLVGGSDTDDVFPYWLYANMKIGPANVTLGRMPMQWTQYTLKKVDVDELFDNEITDNGDYPIDGGKLTLDFGKVNLEAFAAKNNSNQYVSGLTALPNGGMYSPVSAPNGGIPNEAGGRQMGGLGQIEQSAGARLTIPFSETSKLGLSYIQAGQEGGEWEGPDEQLYEKSELMGADLNLMFGKLSLAAEYAQTKAMAVSGGDLDTDNTAMDGKLGYDFGRIQLYGGYREIERNFAAPGSWGKLGRWANPVNIKGPYLNVNSKWGKALTVSSAYESYEPSNTADFGLSDDDELTRQKINVDYAISPTMIFGVGYEQVKWDPTGLDSSKDKYLTLDLSYKMNPDSMLKIGYQIVDYDPGVDGGFYGDDQYKGDIGYVQIGVKF